MNEDQLLMLASIVEELDGFVNSVRFMNWKGDVDYAHAAKEVEVSIHHGLDEVSFFVLQLPDGDEWIETV